MYTEQKNLHFGNVGNKNIYNDSITPHKKQNRIKEDCGGNYKIPFGKNKSNKSIIASKTIEPNTSKKIEPKASNKIERIASKTVDACKTIEQNESKRNKSRK